MAQGLSIKGFRCQVSVLRWQKTEDGRQMADQHIRLIRKQTLGVQIGHLISVF
jgi:hypothetical protein